MVLFAASLTTTEIEPAVTASLNVAVTTALGETLVAFDAGERLTIVGAMTSAVVNVEALGAIVFQNRAKLRSLEHIIHPRVAREQARLTREAARKDPNAVVIYDVPLLFEAGVDKRVDKIVVVTAGRETQIARLKERAGLSRTEALRRIESQMPLARKRARADFVIKSPLATAARKQQVRAILRALRSCN